MDMDSFFAGEHLMLGVSRMAPTPTGHTGTFRQSRTGHWDLEAALDARGTAPWFWAMILLQGALNGSSHQPHLTAISTSAHARTHHGKLGVRAQLRRKEAQHPIAPTSPCPVSGGKSDPAEHPQLIVL